MGFIIWTLSGKKPQIEEQNIQAYNKALGKLWCVFGFFFILLGTPFLLGEEQNSPLFIISMIGVILEVIILMAVYTIKIEEKYRKK